MVGKSEIQKLLEQKEKLDKQFSIVKGRLADLSEKDKQLREMIENDVSDLVSFMKKAQIYHIEKAYSICLNININKLNNEKLNNEISLRLNEDKTSVLYKNSSHEKYIWTGETEKVNNLITNWAEYKEGLYGSLYFQLDRSNKQQENHLQSLKSDADRKERLLRDCKFDKPVENEADNLDEVDDYIVDLDER